MRKLGIYHRVGAYLFTIYSLRAAIVYLLKFPLFLYLVVVERPIRILNLFIY